MQFRVVTTLTPLDGGWSDDAEERLVASEVVEARDAHEALRKVAPGAALGDTMRLEPRGRPR